MISDSDKSTPDKPNKELEEYAKLFFNEEGNLKGEDYRKYNFSWLLQRCRSVSQDMYDREQLRKFETYEGEVLENQGARWENFENTFSARPKSYDEMLYSGVFPEKYDWSGVKDQIFDEIYAKLPLYHKDNKRDYEMESKLLNRLNLFNIYYKNSKSIAEQDLSGFDLLAKSVDHSLNHGGTILHLAAEVKSRKAQSFAKSFISDYLDAKGLKIDKSEHGKYTIELDKGKKSRYFDLKNVYMNALRNSLMYGNCANVLTELPLLHQCDLDFQNKKKEHSNTDNITQLPDRDELISSGWSYEYVNDFYEFAEEVSYDSLMLAMFANTISQRGPNSSARRSMKNYSLDFNNSIKQISLSSFERALKYIEKSFREIKLSYDIEKKETEVIQTVMGFHSRISPLLEVFQAGSFERIDIFLRDIIEDLIKPTWRLGMVRNQVAHGRSANLDSAVRMLRSFEDSLYEGIRLVQRRLMIAKSGKELKNSLSQDNLFRVINDLKSSEAISTHILGGPGQGKTIYMKQMAFNFISNSRKTKNNVIPFYFNAKLISPSDQGFFEKSEAYSHLSDVIVEKLYSSIPNLINYLKRDDLTEFLDLYMKLGIDRSLLFVDGLDECGDSTSIQEITSLLKNSVTKCKHSVILSCRTTRSDEINMNPNYSATMEFSNQELKFIMPKLLCDAWGITRYPLKHDSERLFDRFEVVLTHPLFVGWFCTLLRDESIDDVDFESDGVKFAEFSTNHIKFMKKVVERGIKILLEDVNKPGSIDRYEEVMRCFRLISTISIELNTNNIRLIIEKIQADHKITIDDELQQVIKENFGVAYEYGEEIHWTHKLVPEIAYGELLCDQEYAEYYRSNYRWTEATMITIALIESEDKGESFESTVAELMSQQPFVIIDTMLESIIQPNETIITLKRKSGKYVVVPSAKKGTLNWEIGNHYIKQMSNNSPFSISIKYWDLSSNNDMIPRGLTDLSSKPFMLDIFYQNNQEKLLAHYSLDNIFNIIKDCKDDELKYLHLDSVLQAFWNNWTQNRSTHSESFYLQVAELIVKRWHNFHNQIENQYFNQVKSHLRSLLWTTSDYRLMFAKQLISESKFTESLHFYSIKELELISKRSNVNVNHMWDLLLSGRYENNLDHLMEDFLSEKVPNASSHYLIANSEFISFIIFGGLYNMPIGRLSSDVDVRKLMMGEVEFYFNTELLNHRSFIDYCASIESHVGFFENIPKSLVYDKTICDNFSRYFIESVIRLNQTLDL